MLYALFDIGIIKQNDEEYYGAINKLFIDIKKDSDGNTKKKSLKNFWKLKRLIKS